MMPRHEIRQRIDELEAACLTEVPLELMLVPCAVHDQHGVTWFGVVRGAGEDHQVALPPVGDLECAERILHSAHPCHVQIERVAVPYRIAVEGDQPLEYGPLLFTV